MSAHSRSLSRPLRSSCREGEIQRLLLAALAFGSLLGGLGGFLLGLWVGVGQ